MKKNKHLAIWMDHSNAIFFEIENDTITKNHITSESTLNDEEYSSEKHEKQIHTKEQHQQLDFYRKLSNVIKDCNKVVLFGPTEAKSELLNLLRADHLFKDIKIELKNADKMTKNQMNSFVRDYFK